MRAHHPTSPARWAVLLALALAAACGGDEPTEITPDTIIGRWVVTSLTAPTQPQWGDAVQDDGLAIGFHFRDDGLYDFNVANDWPADPWICPGTVSCGWSGSYSVSGNELLLDEGTSSEVTATLKLNGDDLTLTYPAGDGFNDPYRYVMRRN